MNLLGAFILNICLALYLSYINISVTVDLYIIIIYYISISPLLLCNYKVKEVQIYEFSVTINVALLLSLIIFISVILYNFSVYLSAIKYGQHKFLDAMVLSEIPILGRLTGILISFLTVALIISCLKNDRRRTTILLIAICLYSFCSFSRAPVLNAFVLILFLLLSQGYLRKSVFIVVAIIVLGTLSSLIFKGEMNLGSALHRFMIDLIKYRGIPFIDSQVELLFKNSGIDRIVYLLCGFPCEYLAMKIGSNVFGEIGYKTMSELRYLGRLSEIGDVYSNVVMSFPHAVYFAIGSLGVVIFGLISVSMVYFGFYIRFYLSSTFLMFYAIVQPFYIIYIGSESFWFGLLICLALDFVQCNRTKALA